MDSDLVKLAVRTYTKDHWRTREELSGYIEGVKDGIHLGRKTKERDELLRLSEEIQHLLNERMPSTAALKGSDYRLMREFSDAIEKCQRLSM